MANSIKYSTTPTSNTIKVGNFALGVVTGVTYAPTSTTSFYNGYNVPSGGYVVYQNKATLGPSVFAPTGNTQMVNLTKALGNATATTINDSLKWINEQNTIIAVNREYENIVTSGLTVLLDAGFTPSYPLSGISWTDLSFSGNNGTLTNGPTFLSDNGGSIVFDGVDDYIDNIGSTSSFNFIGSTGIFSIGFWFKMNATNTRTLFIGNTLTNTEKGWLIGVEYGAAGFGNNCIRFQATGNASNTRLIAGSTNDNTIDATTWTHCLFTSTNGDYVGQWYINGVASTTSTRVGTGNALQGSYYGGPAARTLNVGRCNYSSTLIPLAGNVASLFIYNRTLSASEVLQNYNVQKSRYIDPFDADARAFITAAGITNSTQQTAINQLVLDLKSYSLWTKFSAIYPFVGGTATSHKYNLKDPRDLDAAYRIQFNGGWTHNSNGIEGDGSTGYADTFAAMNTVAIPNRLNHWSCYIRVLPSGTQYNGILDQGALKGFGGAWGSGQNWFASLQNFTNSGVASQTGFVNGTVTSTSASALYRNGTSIWAPNYPGSMTNQYNYYLGATNNGASPTFYNTTNIAFTSLGGSMNATNASNLYTAVQAFQTTLGRQV